MENEFYQIITFHKTLERKAWRLFGIALLLTVLSFSQLLAQLPETGFPQMVGITGNDINNSITYSDVAATGTKWVRRAFFWETVETSPGVYNFSAYDDIVAELASRGIGVIGLLVYNNALYENTGIRAIKTEAGRQGYANFAKAIAAHYKDYNIMWELWNEPNTRVFWDPNGTPNSLEYAENYVALVQTTVPKMREGDPDCTILGLSMAAIWSSSLSWLENCATLGLFTSGIDAISIHPYPPAGRNFPELTDQSLTDGYIPLFNLLDSHGASDMPIVITEVGYNVNDLVNRGVPADSVETYQAWELVRQYMIDNKWGIRATTWYTWSGQGQPYALVKNTGRKTPSYFALQHMVALMTGYQFIEQLPTANAEDYLFLFERPEGGKILVAWTSEIETEPIPRVPHPHNLTIPVSETGTLDVLDAFGNQSTVDVVGGEITVYLSGNPQYIILESDGNAAPVASVTAPAEGSLYTAGGDITIEAVASDPDGSIAKVEFYQGYAFLGVDSVAPYSFTWTNVPIGVYPLMVRATDNQGKVSPMSDAVEVNVSFDGLPNIALGRPTVALSSHNDYPHGNINDGNPATRWSSRFYEPNWIFIDLEKVYDISRVILKWESSALVYQVQVGMDTTNWTDIYSTTNGQGGDVELFVSGTGRYIRMYASVRNTTKGFSIWEFEVYGTSGGPPTVSLASPLENASFTAGDNITINALASDTDGVVTNVEFYQDSIKLGQDSTAAYSYTWENVPAGNYTLTAVATDDYGNVTTSAPVSITVLPDSSLWSNRDIGFVQAAGSVTLDEGWTIEGSGKDIWNSLDEFHYVYQPVEGDVEIIARVIDVENTNAWAKAGVMIREKLKSYSQHAFMCVTPENGVSFQRRPITWLWSTSTTVGGVQAPQWVRLVREGYNFTGYHSQDGIDWVQVGTSIVPMDSEAYIGLAVTAHNDGTLCTVLFDNVSIITGGSDSQGRKATSEYVMQDETLDGITMYPNPASERITIRMDKAGFESVRSVRLLNIMGQEVPVEEIQRNATQHTYSISTQDVLNGMYVVRVGYVNGMSKSKKVVIKH